MEKDQVLNDLETGKIVSKHDYETLLNIIGHFEVINCLQNRYDITLNIKTIIEIFRLSNEINQFSTIACYNEEIKNHKKELTQEEYQYCTKLIAKAMPKMRIQGTQDHSRNKKRDCFSETPRFLEVHHDNEPYINRDCTIPEDEIKFEKKLNDICLDNWELYDFLREEKIRQKRYD